MSLDGQAPLAPDAWNAAPYVPAPQQPPPPAMRPLSLAELLDRTFTVYRSRFWLFAGIGSISALLQALIGAVQLIPMHMAAHEGANRPASVFPANMMFNLGLRMSIIFGALFLLYLCVFVVTQAATVHALSEVYLGRWTTIGSSIRATLGKWYRYLGIGIWQAFVLLWIPLVFVIAGAILMAVVPSMLALGVVIILLGFLGGGSVGFIFWLRNSLAVQATVIEALSVRASMRRSKVLTDGAKGRIFVLLLLAGVLNYVASLLQMPLLLFVTFTLASGGKALGSEIAMLLVSFVAHATVEPVAMIGLSLIYFDQRVRKEAFDLLMLLGPEPVPAPAIAFAANPAPSSFVPAASSFAPAAAPFSAAEPIPEPPAPYQPPSLRTDDETLS